MKTFNEIIFIVTPFVVSCAAAYLLGSFVSASWLPVEWTAEARFVTMIWGMIFGFMLLFRLNRGR